jgi:hypothetical protein
MAGAQVIDSMKTAAVMAPGIFIRFIQGASLNLLITVCMV